MAEIMPIIPLKIKKKKLTQLSNQLNLMYETDSVDTQVQILTDNFLLALTLVNAGSKINKNAKC